MRHWVVLKGLSSLSTERLGCKELLQILAAIAGLVFSFLNKKFVEVANNFHRCADGFACRVCFGD
jgi:hypothetical protein